ncbi:hypothetical protein [Rhodococcus sp. T7]|uniref:hypothetical protein n=1 Tax=Rhodococcus sp. T7 TaxID=627444 RepID=UPI00135BCDFB|nr:hypothetical protein [Rhodococcus sp. T7]KAF0957654.1 hypothetical protein MLGJGCBP_09486 [Rhodococcus sp. T7]KAF0963274.1 hypothetical protein MLGJGCBP_03580 [Rhodococcus sp. T7]
MTCELENKDVAAESTQEPPAAAAPNPATARQAAFLRCGLTAVALGALVATGAVLEFPLWFIIASTLVVLATAALTYRSEVALIRSATVRGRRTRTLVAVALLAASTATFAAVAHLHLTVSDERTGQTRAAVAGKAGELTAGVLTYKAPTVEDDVAQAKSHLTGDFLDSYSTLTADTIIPQAKQGQVETHWEASGASVISAESDSAVVLVFLRGTTASAAKPDPTYLFSSVRVRMEASGDQWLISQLEPL